MSDNIELIAKAAILKAQELNASTAEALAGLAEAMVATALSTNVSKASLVTGLSIAFDAIVEELERPNVEPAARQTAPTSTAEH